MQENFSSLPVWVSFSYQGTEHHHRKKQSTSLVKGGLRRSFGHVKDFFKPSTLDIAAHLVSQMKRPLVCLWMLLSIVDKLQTHSAWSITVSGAEYHSCSVQQQTLSPPAMVGGIYCTVKVFSSPSLYSMLCLCWYRCFIHYLFHLILVTRVYLTQDNVGGGMKESNYYSSSQPKSEIKKEIDC